MADNLNGFAEQVGEDVGEIRGRIAPVQRGSTDEFSVSDQDGARALGVTADGATIIGDVEHAPSDGFNRVVDSDGRISTEYDGQGRFHIYDGVVHNSGTSGEITTLHVFVAAGQSNMSGRGRPITGPQSPRIKQFGANSRIVEDAPLVLDMVDVPSGTSPALFFAESYLASQPAHVGVLLIPSAKGATTFSGSPESPAPDGKWTWTKGAAFSPEYALYERSVQQALDAKVAAEAAGYHVIVKGVLWHQGEGNGGMATEDYAALLDALIADYRAELGHSTLPFVVGQQSPEGMEDTPSKYTVDAAHQDTPYRVPFTGFAPSTRNGHNDGDTTHFSTVGTTHLGDTYVTGYIQALGNTRH